jgi:hypothetical protein
VTVAADATLSVLGEPTVTAGADATLSVLGDPTVTAGADATLSVLGDPTVTAGAIGHGTVSILESPAATAEMGANAKPAAWYKSLWWIWLIIAIVAVGGVLALCFICAGRGSSSKSEQLRAEIAQETEFKAEFVAPEATGVHGEVGGRSEIDWMTQENPVFQQDVSDSQVYLDDEPDNGTGAAVVAGAPRRPLLSDSEASDRDDGAGEVWGTVTLTKRLFTGPDDEKGDGDRDDELK